MRPDKEIIVLRRKIWLKIFTAISLNVPAAIYT